MFCGDSSSLTVSVKLSSAALLAFHDARHGVVVSLAGLAEDVGCGEGECGSCSVLMDGALINSCLVPALQAQGAKIITIEGLAPGAQLHALQQAFLDCGGAQCGICTPGIIMAACHLLSKKRQPTLDEIRQGLAGNLCRCTGYAQIYEAVAEAAARRSAG